MGFSLNHILFFHMPRTAGDSIQKSILNISEKCRISTHHNQKSTSRVLRMHIENSNYKSFTFVRNPYNRLYSAYNWIMKRDTTKNEKLNNLDLLEYEYLKQYKDFNHFCCNIDEKGINQHFMVHFHPLSKWIWNDKLLVTNTFRFEDLFNGRTLFKDWCKQNKLIYKGLISESHKSVWTQKSYFDFYNKDSILNVNKLYQRDFQLFGYNKI